MLWPCLDFIEIFLIYSKNRMDILPENVASFYSLDDVAELH